MMSVFVTIAPQNHTFAILLIFYFTIVRFRKLQVFVLLNGSKAGKASVTAQYYQQNFVSHRLVFFKKIIKTIVGRIYAYWCTIPTPCTY